MTIQMTASKRFRLAMTKGFRWIDAGEPYEVGAEKTADYHEKSGRGNRVKTPAATGKKGE